VKQEEGGRGNDNDDKDGDDDHGDDNSNVKAAILYAQSMN
jgi:hypothetical protein